MMNVVRSATSRSIASIDRKSTRLNSSHSQISYAVFCLKKKNRAHGSYEGILYLPCTVENNFLPQPPRELPDVIHLCFPTNPTGTVASRKELTSWFQYAS